MTAVKEMIKSYAAKTEFPRVTFLSVASFERDLISKQKWHKTFDVIFMGCSVTHLLEKALLQNFR